MTKICSDDYTITLPRDGKATIDQCQEQGRITGQAYGKWFVEREERLLVLGQTKQIQPSFDECGAYLLTLNKKMEPVFRLSDDQVDSFNQAALKGYFDFMRPYVVLNAVHDGINEAIAHVTASWGKEAANDRH